MENSSNLHLVDYMLGEKPEDFWRERMLITEDQKKSYYYFSFWCNEKKYRRRNPTSECYRILISICVFSCKFLEVNSIALNADKYKFTAFFKKEYLVHAF